MITAPVMTPTSLRRFFLMSLLLILSAGPALAEEWVIAKVSGAAWISSPNAPVERAAVGMTVPDGATFSTSQNARAQLNRGAETILVSPNTVLSPRSSTFFGTSTTIQQQVGRIELEVEKRNVRHFTVKTPLLAAVVKGTHFTVSVTATSADVQVLRGLVEVSDVKTGASADIRPGQKAMIGGPEGGGLRIAASNPPEARRGQPPSPGDDETVAGGQRGGKSPPGPSATDPGPAVGSGNDGEGKGRSSSGDAAGDAGGGAGHGNGDDSGNAGEGNAGGPGKSGADNHGNGNGNGRGGDRGGHSSGNSGTR